MTKRVLGILGSPCREGNAAALLDAALSGARSEGAETERLDLVALDVRPCVECRLCEDSGSCVQDEDDMSMFYSMFRQVDAVVLSSPVFFMGVTAQTKAMIDRCQCYWVEKYVMGRRAYEGQARPKGLFLSCAGSSKPGIFQPVLHVAKAFFAAIDYEYSGEVLLGHTDDPALGPRKEESLRQAFEAGRKLV